MGDVLGHLLGLGDHVVLDPGGGDGLGEEAGLDLRLGLGDEVVLETGAGDGLGDHLVLHAGGGDGLGADLGLDLGLGLGDELGNPLGLGLGDVLGDALGLGDVLELGAGAGFGLELGKKQIFYVSHLHSLSLTHYLSRPKVYFRITPINAHFYKTLKYDYL